VFYVMLDEVYASFLYLGK